MGKASFWYRLVLIATLLGGFFLSVEEGVTRKTLAETLIQICSVGEDMDDEAFLLDYVPLQDPLLLASFRIILPDNRLTPDTPVVNAPKLFLLYQQWKLHC